MGYLYGIRQLLMPPPTVQYAREIALLMFRAGITGPDPAGEALIPQPIMTRLQLMTEYARRGQTALAVRDVGCHAQAVHTHPPGQ